jgi:Big-like domain-containing protein
MSRCFARNFWRTGNRRGLAGVWILAIAAYGANCSGGPTTPSPTPADGDQLLALTVSCQAALIIGERAPCTAVASYGSGRQPLVSLESTWSSSHPDVVAVDGVGLSTGKSAGEATVTASYQGLRATAVIVVREEDALRISTGQAHQGDFTPGSTVTMWLQGYYSVASAATGRLSLKITDQTGTIGTTAPLAVAKGGDSFLLSSTFVVPDTSVEVCRTAVLEVGTVTIAEPHSKAFPLWCISIRR